MNLTPEELMREIVTVLDRKKALDITALKIDPALLLFLLFLRRFRLGQGIIIAPVFGIFFQNPQPLESFFIGVISNLAEQLVGILLKIQQIDPLKRVPARQAQLPEYDPSDFRLE